MPDLSEGQKAVIHQMIRENITSFKKEEVDPVVELAEKLDSTTKTLKQKINTPLYKRTELIGVTSVVIIALAGVFFDKVIMSGSLPLSKAFHWIVGTSEVFATGMNDANGEVRNSLSDFIDLKLSSLVEENEDNKNSQALGARIDAQIQQVISKETRQYYSDDMIPAFVRTVLKMQPTLSFSGQHVFGLDQEIQVTSDRCEQMAADVLKNSGNNAITNDESFQGGGQLEDCLLRGYVLSKAQQVLPFYAFPEKYPNRKPHDVWFLTIVQKIPVDGGDIISDLDGLDFYVDQDLIELTPLEIVEEGTIYFANISNNIHKPAEKLRNVKNDLKIFIL